MGSTLIYNSNNASSDRYPEIDEPDVDEFRHMLRQNRNIRTLQLTSTGGLVWASEEIARLVIDYELDTRVSGECSSACATIFLAGSKRSLEPGSKIGFHLNNWSTTALIDYYKGWRESENWSNPFEFTAQIYRDTQHETAEDISYLLSRGVDPAFAIETKRYRTDLWFPSKSELLSAGVIHY